MEKFLESIWTEQ